MKVFNLKAPDWRRARWLGFVLVVGVLLLTLRGLFQTGGKAAGTASAPVFAEPSSALPPAADPVSAEEATLDVSMEGVLSGIAGVGRVRVRVALAASDQRRFAHNTTSDQTTTTETDQTGAVRKTAQANVQDQVVLTHGPSNESPVTVEVLRPEVRGVLVVAQGADFPVIQAEITRAVAAGLGVPLYRVVVLPAKGGMHSVPQ